ncbi:hypothetical protein FGO68_gene14958 [Halteria grandinella]|uniref:C2 domain-containing protein n=1 Tax=Halteria grandinella TaxID=5974 RepID=A0A8J8NBN3_HALGN|nr:hypothetical protein FGO68_gene14958 [Halteria grandinella]
MDPYLVLECNGQKAQTKVHHGGGKYPVWNQVREYCDMGFQSFDFTVNSQNDEILIKCFDSDPGKDDFVGQCRIKVSTLCINNGVREWINMDRKQKLMGQIMLETRFTPYVQNDQQMHAQTFMHAQPMHMPQMSIQQPMFIAKETGYVPQNVGQTYYQMGGAGTNQHPPGYYPGSHS